MNKLNLLEEFNNIYHDTYKTTLKFVITHCNNLDDINDILQDTYLEFYKSLKKKKSIDVNVSSYIIGIARNIINKHYHKKYKARILSDNSSIENVTFKTDEDIELNFITKENVEKIWKYIEKKNIIVSKIFYCYYYLDMKISDISTELNLNESSVKNHIYRTIKEIKENFKKERDNND